MQYTCPACNTRMEWQVDSGETLSCPSCGRSMTVAPMEATVELASAEVPSQPSPGVPDRLGRYRVLEVLGTGGFGVVYKGLDEQLCREVAIKVPHRDCISTDRDVDAFLSEARTLASLDHPAIVPAYDAGRTDDGLCYLVSKFVDGTNLAQRMRNARLPYAESAELVARVAEALHHAHQRGLVHRDVKPANILLDKQGNPYVADFGLVLRETDQPNKQPAAGTPAYMSPEQANGEGHRVDARTDVYSLGVVLYELLTGRRPFRGKSVSDLLEQIAAVEARPPRQADDSIPKELDRICLKALSKRVADRYSTAADLADDLRHWLQERSDSVTPVGDMSAGSAVGTSPASGPQAALPGTAPASAESSVAGKSDPSSGQAKSLGTGLGPAKIVPKGLRSFDGEDADFFLELLPGPRDREGLPGSVRFWKSRIDRTDSEQTFTVGLLYGPSGCGKSSLVKAGILPRLAAHVTPVYVEATPDATEARIVSGLRKACPGLSTELGLVDSFAALRRGEGIPADTKVVLFVDQFEQWLHATRTDDDTALVQALRHCDGVRLQCVVMIRDDFWMSITRFMRELEVPLVEGTNSAAVDLFSPRHARKVLVGFGRAFGCLGAGEPTSEQKEFLQSAVISLAEDGAVVPVRLALFADMVKTRPWTPAVLKQVGGAEGIGVTFLEETFSASTAPPEHRYHQRAARRVLKSLLYLPGQATNIKGRMRSYAELLHASGYARRPRDFDDLLRILDSELRLVTPTDPEGAEEGASGGERASPPSEKYYQLTHDYLVPSLRQWLTRKQRETMRGRAELRLAERAEVWSVRPQARHLPAWWETLNIALLTRGRDWTSPQRKMMRAASRRHISHALLLVSCLVLLALGGREVYGRLRAATLSEQVLYVETPLVPPIVEQMGAYRRWTDPRLREAQRRAEQASREKLNASLALLPSDPSQVDFLYDEALKANGASFLTLCDALFDHREQLSERLRTLLADGAADASKRTQAGLMLAHFTARSEAAADEGPPDFWSENAAFLAEQLLETAVNDTSRYESLLEGFKPIGMQLVEHLRKVYQDTSRDASQRSIAMNIVERYAGDDPMAVADVMVTSGDPKRFAKGIALLKQHRDEAIAFLQGELGKDPDTELKPDWEDAPLDLTWSAVDPAMVQRIESGLGMLAERFAFCQTLTLEDFLAVAEGMRDAGYRPTRLRPYQADGTVRVAAVWTRDGIAWRLAHGLTAEEVAERNREWMSEEFFTVDLAGYLDGEFRFAMVAANDPIIEESMLSVGIPASETRAEFERIRNTGAFMAMQIAQDADGQSRHCWTRVRYNDSNRRASLLFVNAVYEAQFEESVARAPLPLVDVSLCAVPPPKTNRERYLELLEQANEVLNSRPNDLEMRFNRGFYHYVLRNDAEVIDDCTFVIQQDPSRATAYSIRAEAYARTGRTELAKADLATFLKLSNDLAEKVHAEACVSAFLGEDEGGMAKLEQFIAEHATDADFVYNVAAAYSIATTSKAVERQDPARLQRYADRAVELLNLAFANGFSQYYRLERPAWDPLREHPGFQELLARGRLDRHYVDVSQTTPNRQSRESHGLDPEEHLEKCRELAADGCRPKSIAVASLGDGKPLVTASAWHRPVVTDEAKDTLAERQAHAAVVSLTLEETDSVWSLLQPSPEPRVRTFLVHRLPQFDVAPATLLDRIDSETDAGVRQGLLLALGEYENSADNRDQTEEMFLRVLEWYRSDPDPGIHSTVEWLLRKWRQDTEIAGADVELANLPFPTWDEESNDQQRRWHMNRQGDTLVLIRGPVEFEMGAPGHEPGKSYNERRHPRRIDRSFAIGTKEVTYEQFQRFLDANPKLKESSRATGGGPDYPVVGVTWFEAAQYCRWLSEQEGMPEDQMCYPPINQIKDGMTPAEDYLSRRGYRLPSEAEWEYACRAGTVTMYSFGSSVAMLPQYAWFKDNSEQRTHPVGELKPNGFGVFGQHGNVCEWCYDPYIRDYPEPQGGPILDTANAGPIGESSERAVRGGAYADAELVLRSARRFGFAASKGGTWLGFRIARTISGPASPDSKTGE